MSDAREYLKKRVYDAAKDGMAMSLFILLNEYDDPNSLLNEVSFIADFCAKTQYFLLCRKTPLFTKGQWHLWSLAFSWQVNKFKFKL